MYRNFRTNLDRPTVRSCLSAKLQFRDSLSTAEYRLRCFLLSVYVKTYGSLRRTVTVGTPFQHRANLK